MFLDHLKPGTDYEVTVSALFGRSVGPAASLTIRTGEKSGRVPFSGWLGRTGYRGSTDTHVSWAASSVEQTLRPIILSPTSILLSWNLVPEARGYRLEWHRESGQCVWRAWRQGLGLGFS